MSRIRTIAINMQREVRCDPAQQFCQQSGREITDNPARITITLTASGMLPLAMTAKGRPTASPGKPPG